MSKKPEDDDLPDEDLLDNDDLLIDGNPDAEELPEVQAQDTGEIEKLDEHGLLDDGDANINAVGIDDRGHLIFGFDDGKELDIGLVVGGPGQDGASIASAHVNKAGRLIVEMSDGSKKDAGHVRGPEGKGVKGDTGMGVAGFSINKEGNLLVGFTDGRVKDLGHVRGEVGLAPEHRWDGLKLKFKNPDGKWGKEVDLRAQILLHGKKLQIGARGGNDGSSSQSGAGAVPTTLQDDFVIPAHTQVSAGRRMIVGAHLRIVIREDAALVRR